MIIYSASKREFDSDVRSGKIADKISSAFLSHGIPRINEREYISWKNSLEYMRKVLDSPCFSDDITIAAEYRLPQTSKRADLMIAGNDADGNPNVVLVELKQWSSARKTTRKHIVKTYTGGMICDVPHTFGSYSRSGYFAYARIVRDGL